MMRLFIVFLAIFAAFLLFLNFDEEMQKDAIVAKNNKQFEICSKKYLLDYSSDIRLDKNSKKERAINLLRGDMGFRVFDANKSVVKVGFYFEPSSYSVNGINQPKEPTEELYKNIILAKLNNQGEFLEFQLPSHLHQDDKNVLLSLIQPLEWKLNNDTDNLYKTVQRDISGEYDAIYNGSKKLKKRYYNNEIDVQYSILKSDFLDTTCWHTNITLNESIEYKPRSDRYGMNIKTNYSLQGMKTLSVEHPLMLVDDFDTLWDKYLQKQTSLNTVREKYHQKIRYEAVKEKNITLDDLIVNIDSINKNTLEEQILAFLLNDPSGLQVLEEGFKNGAYNEYQMAIILRALGRMNRADAQLLLSDVLVAKFDMLDKNYQFWAALELGKQTTSLPTIVKERLFEQLHLVGINNEDKKRISASIYAIGLVARSLVGEDDNYANELIEELISNLNATSDDEIEKKAYLLGALGNTGKENLIELAKGYLDNEEDVIREKAVVIIANDYSDESTQILEEVALEEQDDIIQQRAIESIALRGSIDNDMVVKIFNLANDTKQSTMVHNSTINYLVNHLGPTVQNRNRLKELLKKETSAQNVEKLIYKIKSIDNSIK